MESRSVSSMLLLGDHPGVGDRFVYLGSPVKRLYTQESYDSNLREGAHPVRGRCRDRQQLQTHELGSCSLDEMCPSRGPCRAFLDVATAPAQERTNGFSCSQRRAEAEVRKRDEGRNQYGIGMGIGIVECMQVVCLSFFP